MVPKCGSMICTRRRPAVFSWWRQCLVGDGGGLASINYVKAAVNKMRLESLDSKMSDLKLTVYC